MFWQLFYLLSKILTVNKWVKVEYESKVQTKIYKNLIIFEVKIKRSTFINLLKDLFYILIKCLLSGDFIFLGKTMYICIGCYGNIFKLYSLLLYVAAFDVYIDLQKNRNKTGLFTRNSSKIFRFECLVYNSSTFC